MLSIFVAVALISQKSVHSKTFNSVMGPYISYVDRFLKYESPGHQLPWTYNLRTSHFNPQKPHELQVINGNVTGVNITIDDTCWLKVVMDVWSNNQWKANAFIFDFKDKACRTFKRQLPGFFQIIFKKKETSGVCTIAPGSYEINHEPANWTFPSVPVMFYGAYKFQVFIGKAKNRYFALISETHLIPQ